MKYIAQQLILRKEPGLRPMASLPELLHETGIYESAQEVVFVVSYDSRAMIGNLVEVARGDHSQVTVSVPILIGAVLASGCKRFWLGHNHPSGHLVPTDLDVQLTAQIQIASSIAGLTMEDHIIVGPPNGWYSFEDDGKMPTADEAVERLVASAGEQVLRCKEAR